jgi:GT2 family glycosyltransferase
MTPTVAVIVLSWNGRADTLECLESLRRSDYPAMNVIVVDNGSTDGSIPTVRDRFPEVRIIDNGLNLGFVGGNNVGLRAALAQGADLVFVLNNDTVLHPACISELVRALDEDPAIGIVGPLMQRTIRPDLVDMGGNFDFRLGSVRLLNYVEGDTPEGLVPIDYVWGCGLMARAEVLRSVGLFDPRYGAYFEDADFCMRAQAHGYRTAVATKARMVHKIGRSGEKRFAWQTAMRLRNHVLFFLSYAQPREYPLLVPALLFFQLPAMCVRTARLYLARKLVRRYHDRPISLWYRDG